MKHLLTAYFGDVALTAAMLAPALAAIAVDRVLRRARGRPRPDGA